MIHSYSLLNLWLRERHQKQHCKKYSLAKTRAPKLFPQSWLLEFIVSSESHHVSQYLHCRICRRAKPWSHLHRDQSARHPNDRRRQPLPCHRKCTSRHEVWPKTLDGPRILGITSARLEEEDWNYNEDLARFRRNVVRQFPHLELNWYSAASNRTLAHRSIDVEMSKGCHLTRDLSCVKKRYK